MSYEDEDDEAIMDAFAGGARMVHIETRPKGKTITTFNDDETVTKIEVPNPNYEQPENKLSDYIIPMVLALGCIAGIVKLILL